MSRYIFTSESVSEGHPDKICDAISDGIVDLFLSKDQMSRCAIEVMATTNLVIIAGETKCNADVSEQEIEGVVRDVVKKVGYDQKGFSWQTLTVKNYLHHQSSDIALGVDSNGAGDQGIMFGYAKKENGYDTNYMPMPIYLAHKILKNLATSRHNKEIVGIEPDAKSQVSVIFEDGKPVGIDNIIVSTQHHEHLSLEDVRAIVLDIIKKSIPVELMPDEDKIFINPTGRFVIGGPDGDAGLTGRKIVVDTYGGAAMHGGGAFSGKDPTKVDRSAAYMMRYLAKNIVAAGLCDRCMLQISYAIGKKEPMSLWLNCLDSNHVEEEKIIDAIYKLVDLSPQGIIKHLDLLKPIYSKTVNYGHFGKEGLSWEKLDLVEDFRRECL